MKNKLIIFSIIMMMLLTGCTPTTGKMDKPRVSKSKETTEDVEKKDETSEEETKSLDDKDDEAANADTDTDTDADTDADIAEEPTGATADTATEDASAADASSTITNDDVHALYRQLIDGTYETNSTDDTDARAALLSSAEYCSDLQYTYFDMNRDGLDELIVAEYGPFHVFSYVDGAIRYVGNTFGYSSGSPSFLLSSGEVLSVDTAHAGRQVYQVFSLTKEGTIESNLLFTYEFPDPGYEIPDEVYSVSYDVNGELQEITKEEFETLRDTYMNQKSNISFAPLTVKM